MVLQLDVAVYVALVAQSLADDAVGDDDTLVEVVAEVIFHVVEVEIAVFASEGQLSLVGAVVDVGPVALHLAPDGVFLSVDVARDAGVAVHNPLDGGRDGQHVEHDGRLGIVEHLVVGEVAVVVGHGAFQVDVAHHLSVAEVGVVGACGEAGWDTVVGGVLVEGVWREGVGHGEWRDDL